MVFHERWNCRKIEAWITIQLMLHVLIIYVVVGLHEQVLVIKCNVNTRKYCRMCEIRTRCSEISKIWTLQLLSTGYTWKSYLISMTTDTTNTVSFIWEKMNMLISQKFNIHLLLSICETRHLIFRDLEKFG